MTLPSPIRNLITAFSRLPGIGPKTSERLVFSLLKKPSSEMLELATALLEFSKQIRLCPICFHFSDNGSNGLCAICNDSRRDQTLLCVVGDNLDLIAMETSGYHGRYHILGGLLNPLRNITADDLRINELFQRINNLTEDELTIKEIILAFDPNHEGEITASYIKRALSGLPIKITRLARGLPQGGDLDYADEITLSEALKGRREV